MLEARPGLGSVVLARRPSTEYGTFVAFSPLSSRRQQTHCARPVNLRGIESRSGAASVMCSRRLTRLRNFALQFLSSWEQRRPLARPPLYISEGLEIGADGPAPDRRRTAVITDCSGENRIAQLGRTRTAMRWLFFDRAAASAEVCSVDKDKGNLRRCQDHCRLRRS
jgi:hypothetical protein